MSRQVRCTRCGARRPPVAVQYNDAFCSRECAEREHGTWERSQRYRRLLLLTSRHHRVLDLDDD